MRHNIRGPVDHERGEKLYGPAIASGIAGVLGGEINPEMRAKDIKYEKQKQFQGNFELTVIADGSSSMRPDHNRGENRTKDQKQAIILIFEALKKLGQKAKQSTNPLMKQIEFETQGMMFTGQYGVAEFKPMSSDMNDKHRLQTTAQLNYNDGDYTNGYDALKRVRDEYQLKTPAQKEQIKTGKKKKIIICITDGSFNLAYSQFEKYKKNREGFEVLTKANHRMSQILVKKMRAEGIIVYGVGMTTNLDDLANLQSIFGEFDPLIGGSLPCGMANNVGNTLGKLLQPHLLKFTTLT